MLLETSLYSQIDAADPHGCVRAIKQRLMPILECAREHQAFVMIDMEQYDFKHIILACFLEILEDDTFRHWPDFGIAIQTYLTESYDDLLLIVEAVKKRNTPASIRVVRGAYWDYETIIADQNNGSLWIFSCCRQPKFRFSRGTGYIARRKGVVHKSAT